MIIKWYLYSTDAFIINKKFKYFTSGTFKSSILHPQIITLITYPSIFVTQRGSWYRSGELVNSSKPIIKGYMEENMKNRVILFKTFTDVEFYGENDQINRNIENSMTIAI